MESLKHWRHHLEGHTDPILVRCDHKNLGYYKKPQSLTARQTRWHQRLSEFNIKLEYTPGTQLVAPDRLSRQADFGKEEPLSKTVIPNSMVINATDIDLQDQIRSAYAIDQVIQDTIRFLASGNTPMRSQLTDWVTND